MHSKIAATFFLCGAILLAPHTAAQARFINTQHENVSIAPRWINSDSVYQELEFDNGIAYCVGIITGKTGTTDIDALFILERKTGSTSWVVEKTWTKSADDIYLSFYDSDSVSEGYTYRFTVSANVIRNGISEKINVSMERTY